jgi:hypothetical protein
MALVYEFSAARRPRRSSAGISSSWGVFSFYKWAATFRHNMALQLVFLTLSAAEVINGDYGRTVLPIGPFTPSPAESPGRREVFTEPEPGKRG